MNSRRVAHAKTETDEESEGTRLSSDQGGFVLPWIALMLLVLIAMAGFGVDVWNWWYTAQKAQRAADAGALAGVPYMPNLNQNPTPNAETTAIATVQANGFPTATATQGVKTNQLVVTVNTTVNNYFTSLLGLQTTSITRSAEAEFNAPVQMGSPAGHLGNDPDNGGADKHWLNIGAPAVDKHTGDRFADFSNCSGNTYQCSGSSNSEYTDSLYTFTVDLSSSNFPGGGVDIQVYDPEYADGNQNCDNQWLSAAQINTLATTGNMVSDAATRYGTGQGGGYCTGDDNTNLNASGTNGQATAWMVRDGNANNFVIGSVISGCSTQFKPYVPPASSPNYWFDLLDSTNSNGTGAYANDNGKFYASFHRWDTVCHIPAAGRYYLQVRSSIPLGNDIFGAADPNANLAGQNRYSIRVVNTGTNVDSPAGSTYALSKLPVYTNTTAAATPSFYLARLVPGGGTSGRVLNLEFYDIGDVGGGTTTLNILQPNDATLGAGDSFSCSQWTFSGGTGSGSTPPTGSTTSGSAGNVVCSLSGITSNDYSNGFNGVLVNVKVNVPASYNCSTGLTTGCWFKIQMVYTSGAQANDTTTWGANIGGDPVRLIQ